LFLKDLNCLRPITTIIVISAGQTKMSLGRTFRLREQMSLQNTGGVLQHYQPYGDQ
jgi:hypothetical protein